MDQAHPDVMLLFECMVFINIFRSCIESSTDSIFSIKRSDGIYCGLIMSFTCVFVNYIFYKSRSEHETYS